MYPDTLCRLQAHRGVSTDAPENTMAAFRAAAEQGYEMIEMDPKFTKDNVCVVLHDKTLNRTGRRKGTALDREYPISETEFSELCDIDVGEWFSEAFRGEHVPTMAEALSFMRENNIEAKIDNVAQYFSDEQLEILFDIIEKKGGVVGLTCTKLDVLRRFAERFPNAPLHYDGEISRDTLTQLKGFSDGHRTTVWSRLDTPMSAWCKMKPVDKSTAEIIHSFGFDLGIWILQNDDEMKRALELGADVAETTGGIKPWGKRIKTNG